MVGPRVIIEVLPLGPRVTIGGVAATARAPAAATPPHPPKASSDVRKGGPRGPAVASGGRHGSIPAAVCTTPCTLMVTVAGGSPAAVATTVISP